MQRAGTTTVDLEELTECVSNGEVDDEDVTGESDYSEGVQRMGVDQQERSRLDRAGVG